MDFHFITIVIVFRESNMQTLGDLRKKILGMINCQYLLSEKNLNETNFIKIICAHLN